MRKAKEKRERKRKRDNTKRVNMNNIHFYGADSPWE